MDEIKGLLTEIRWFCQIRKITEKTFGTYVKNDSRLVQKLKDGRITVENVNTIKKYLKDHSANTFQYTNNKRNKNRNTSENPDEDRYSADWSEEQVGVRLVITALCGHLGVSAELVLTPHLQKEIILASGDVTTAARIRARAAYLLHTSMGIPQTEVARLFGVTKQAISKSLRPVESEMDDPQISTAMRSMDQMLRQISAGQHVTKARNMRAEART